MGHKALPGHPELGLTEGIKFSSGRLGHVWGHVNGVALAQPGGLWTQLGKGNQSFRASISGHLRHSVLN